MIHKESAVALTVIFTGAVRISLFTTKDQLFSSFQEQLQRNFELKWDEFEKTDAKNKKTKK